MRRILVFVCLVLFTSPAAGQDFSAVQIRTIPVADGLHMLMGQGGNLAVLSGPDGVILVDDQFAPLTEKIQAAVAALGAGPVRFVVNTHWHGDHTGGNENLGKAGAVIVAHENVRARMSVRQVMKALGRDVPPSPKEALPVITFPEELTFHLNGVQIHVRHVASAHTDGDAILHFVGRDALHLGDVYFNGFYPFIDVGSGGSLPGLIAAVDAALALAGAETRIIPGHGPLSNRAELGVYREMLVTVRDRLLEAIAAGQSDEEILAARPTADLDPQWGGGFMKAENFLRLCLASLRPQADGAP